MRVTRNTRKYLIMVWELSLAEFRMKDQGSVFGFFWTLLHPLIYFLVLYGLFIKWMGNHIPFFGLYLIIGIIQWNFFSAATSNSILSVVRSSNYIKSINFPKSVVVISSIVAVLLSHLLELVVLLILLFIFKGSIGYMAVGLIPLLLLNLYVTIAVSFVLATVGVYFLDIVRIWGIVTNVGLFVTPIFYSLDMISPEKRKIIELNFMTPIIQATRDILIYDKTPQLDGILYVFVSATVIFIFGFWLFKKNEGNFAERI
jgi:ABC-type polysaccharide/polyol phosphate export permease